MKMQDLPDFKRALDPTKQQTINPTKQAVGILIKDGDTPRYFLIYFDK